MDYLSQYLYILMRKLLDLILKMDFPKEILLTKYVPTRTIKSGILKLYNDFCRKESKRYAIRYDERKDHADPAPFYHSADDRQHVPAALQHGGHHHRGTIRGSRGISGSWFHRNDHVSDHRLCPGCILWFFRNSLPEIRCQRSGWREGQCRQWNPSVHHFFHFDDGFLSGDHASASGSDEYACRHF